MQMKFAVLYDSSVYPNINTVVVTFYYLSNKWTSLMWPLQMTLRWWRT